VKSNVRADGGNPSTAASVAAPCFSAYGELVVAKYTAPAFAAPAPSSNPAATASVKLSSS
jgi:hypothetical protein